LEFDLPCHIQSVSEINELARYACRGAEVESVRFMNIDPQGLSS